jgi:hypothetical protein
MGVGIAAFLGYGVGKVDDQEQLPEGVGFELFSCNTVQVSLLLVHSRNAQPTGQLRQRHIVRCTFVKRELQPSPACIMQGRIVIRHTHRFLINCIDDYVLALRTNFNYEPTDSIWIHVVFPNALNFDLDATFSRTCNVNYSLACLRLDRLKQRFRWHISFK